jgi:hypothetical protein
MSSEARDNAATIADIPAELMSDQQRRRAMERALAGDDIYAYQTGGFWNLWDGEMMDEQTGYRGVRIPLGEEAS